MTMTTTKMMQQQQLQVLPLSLSSFRGQSKRRLSLRLSTSSSDASSSSSSTSTSSSSTTSSSSSSGSSSTSTRSSYSSSSSSSYSTQRSFLVARTSLHRLYDFICYDQGQAEYDYYDECLLLLPEESSSTEGKDLDSNSNKWSNSPPHRSNSSSILQGLIMLILVFVLLESHLQGSYATNQLKHGTIQQRHLQSKLEEVEFLQNVSTLQEQEQQQQQQNSYYIRKKASSSSSSSVIIADPTTPATSPSISSNVDGDESMISDLEYSRIAEELQLKHADSIQQQMGVVLLS